MSTIKTILILIFFALWVGAKAQPMDQLKDCIGLALENNHSLKKSQLDREKSKEARREMLGNLLPQVNGSGNLNYNLMKPKFIMPNFINEMLPPAAQDPNAAKYMTIEMGTDYSAGLGAALNQQILNFPLFSALEITKTAENLAELGVESKEEEIIAQTANLFYAIQSTIYASQQMEQSIGLIDKMLVVLEANYQNGLMKKIDVDRVKITKVNLITQQSAIKNAIEVQKNLLKLQMGLTMDQPIELVPIDFKFFEELAGVEPASGFEPHRMLPLQIIQFQQKMGELQVKSVLGETLPSLSLGLNYQHNFVSDEFFRGDTYYSYPSSVIGLNLRVPIFAGMSKSAKLKGAKIELLKLKEDELSLNKSLTMAYQNALLKLNDSKKTIMAQRENQVLAEEVFKISESNYLQGLASMSDVLNANSSLVQSQISYADALNNCMKAWIELHKANGTIKEIVK